MGRHHIIMQAELVGKQATAQFAYQERGHRRKYICSERIETLRTLQGMSKLNSLARGVATELFRMTSHSEIRVNVIDDLAELKAGQALVNPETAMGRLYRDQTMGRKNLSLIHRRRLKAANKPKP